jgi:UDP-N-acetylmuramyl tripeptide synthase
MELNRIFASMRDAEVSYVIMEVSSHAIALDRIYGIDFDLCLFTNSAVITWIFTAVWKSMAG